MVGEHSWRCTVQGFARVYFSLVEFGLITSITLTCYLMIVKHEFSIQEVSLDLDFFRYVFGLRFCVFFVG